MSHGKNFKEHQIYVIRVPKGEKRDVCGGRNKDRTFSKFNENYKNIGLGSSKTMYKKHEENYLKEHHN